MTVNIPLGSKDRVEQLFSFPNSPTCPWTLPETVKHWFDMTLDRDGLAARGAHAAVTAGSGGYVLTLDGPAMVQDALKGYQARLPQFLDNGWQALTTVVPKIKAEHRWDPSPDTPKPGQPPYQPWRFFLPLGMAMLNQKALLFFHYPPIRLLETNQDYLNDPVPVRCEELLTANGATAADLPLFNTVMDATPIGAEDDQGSKKAGDTKWGLIPIQDFHEYQKAQVKLLLNPAPGRNGYTVPIAVYGAHPRDTFNELYQAKLDLKTGPTAVVEIVPGRKTPVIVSTHPYAFYVTAQGDPDRVGSGKLVNPAGATARMIEDLVVARWLKLMADDPTQPAERVLADCRAYWTDPARKPTVSALVRHQGSLTYSDPKTLAFTFLVPLSATDQAASPPAAVPSPSAPPAPRPAPARGSAAGLSVIGDKGKPVDWWFIYKVSSESESSKGLQARGTEYAYFDAGMAASGGALMQSASRVNRAGGALCGTLQQMYGGAARSNKQLGWFFYNDEDPQKPDGYANSSRGHCKGVLAFDLATDSGFWLVQSTPRFPVPKRYSFPNTGMEMAQTFLCMTLPGADTARAIADLMYRAHRPNVYLASAVPAGLAADDPRALLMQDKVAPGTQPVADSLAFSSRDGQPFLLIAKNKWWGKDFYNDLVGPILHESLKVETWLHWKTPGTLDSDKTHKVAIMHSVNLEPLDIPYSWSEEFDHAKLAISDESEKVHMVCVGDINDTTAQRSRDGGTVAFQCDALWNSLVRALSDQPEPARPKKKKVKKAKQTKRTKNTKKKGTSKKRTSAARKRSATGKKTSRRRRAAR